MVLGSMQDIDLTLESREGGWILLCCCAGYYYYCEYYSVLLFWILRLLLLWIQLCTTVLDTTITVNTTLCYCAGYYYYWQRNILIHIPVVVMCSPVLNLIDPSSNVCAN